MNCQKLFPVFLMSTEYICKLFLLTIYEFAAFPPSKLPILLLATQTLPQAFFNSQIIIF